jgi:hypothetical protein
VNLLFKIKTSRFLDILEVLHLWNAGLRLNVVRVRGLLVVAGVPLRELMCQWTSIDFASVFVCALFGALVQGYVLITNRAKLNG